MTTAPGFAASSALPASAEDIRQVLGTLTDSQITAIVATGAALADVEVAAAYAEGEGDLAGRNGRPLEGAAAAVFDILSADDALREPDR